MAQTSSSAGRRLEVPLLDLRRQFATIHDEVMQAVERVLESQQLILGEEVAAFEREFAAQVGCAEAVGCASGTDALWLALLAAGIEPGDEVLTTPFSFFASASAIIRAGARPVFSDIDPVTFNLDVAQVSGRLRRGGPGRVRAILPVHLFGQCADMDGLGDLATEFRLAIIEDAAQAVGATWRGRRAGSFGKTAAFSFYPSKNLSAAGDAGCLTTSDGKAAERARILRNHGSPRRYQHVELGANSRLDAIQAAVLRAKMRHLAAWNKERRNRAAEYDRLLRDAGLPGTQPAKGTPLVLPQAVPGHVFHQYCVRALRRDELRAFLGERGIGTEVYYPAPLHLQPTLLYLGYSEGAFPQAEAAAHQVLALPMFPELTAEEQRYVVEAVTEFYG